MLKEIEMTESDYIIQHLRMDIDKLKANNHNIELENKVLRADKQMFVSLRQDLEKKIYDLETALCDEWSVEEIHYCTRCGRPMPEPAWSDEINEYCDICAGDMGVI